MSQRLIDANLALLDQALALLDDIPAPVYTATPTPGLASVGGHMRHVLDHYACFLGGLESGRIDYDARTRDAAVEQDPAVAARAARTLAARLRACGDGAPRLEVRMDCGGNTAGIFTASSVAREAQFLVSHTVHHLALIRGLLADTKVTVPDEFGVAPSTLAHRRRTECAR